MIQVRNNAALTSPVTISASGTQVPFDTVVLNTNSSTSLNNGAIQINRVGYYDTDCTVVLTNSAESAVTVTIAGYANGNALTGATVTKTIAASATETLSLNWIINVISSMNSTANIYWIISGGAVTMSNAFANVSKYC